jgi:hypothetical protein
VPRWLLPVVAACGSDPAPPDAMPDAALRCDPTTPFAAPVAVDGLNTTLDDATARLTADELMIVFSRRQTNMTYDLYQATRASREEPFAGVSLIATVNSVNSDVWPTISGDGLVLMFDSDRAQPGMFRPYVAKRASLTEPFGPPAVIPELMIREVQLSLANLRSLYFTSPNAVRTGQGMEDIWHVALDENQALTGTPTAVLGGVNSPVEEVAAALTEDELHIFFRRTVAAEPDIYMSSRSTVNDGFGASTPVPVVAIAAVNEVPTWVSADGCNLYLFSDAPNGAGGQDIYVARRGSP